jgi:peptide/nickel transport system substrate-binding protein
VIFPGVWQKTNAAVMDVKVRQALSLAINREEMAKTFFKGYGTPATRSWTAENSWGYNSAWKADPYDPAKAKQLLAEAGYPNKFSDPVIPIYSYQLTGAPWLPGWAQIVSGYWEEIGVKTKITPIDGALIRTMYTAKPVDPKVVGTALAYQGSGANFSYYNAVNLYATAGNVELIRDKAYDDILLAVPQEQDEAKRKQLFQQAMDKGHDYYVDIMTVNVPAAYAVSKKVGAFPNPTGPLERAYEGIKAK